MILSLPVKIGIALCVVLMVGGVAWFVPPDMDTFMQFQPLGCLSHPLSQPPCGNWDLTIAGFIPWPRAYDYQGLGAYSLAYLPFYLAFPQWESVLAVNILWMVLAVWFFIRLTRVNPWIAAFVFGANFFFSYNLVHDYQVGFHMALFFAVPWLALRILEAPTRRRWLALNAILGIAVFLGAEYKPIFLYYLPASLILVIALRPPHLPVPALIMTLLRRCWPAMALAGFCLLLIVFATLPDGKYYWKLLQQMSHHYPTFDDPTRYLAHVRNLMAGYLVDFTNSGGLVYGPYNDTRLLRSPLRYEGVLITAPFWAVTAVIYGCFLGYKPAGDDAGHYRERRRTFLALLAAGLVTLLLIATQMKTRHAFHLLPVMLCLLGALALGADHLRRTRLPLVWLGGVLVTSQFFCLVWLVTKEPRPGHSWARLPAIEYAAQPELAKHATIVDLDWGVYFISTLYGPKDMMVIGAKRNYWPLKQWIRTAREHDRKLVFVRQHKYSEKFQRIRKRLRLVKVFPKRGRSRAAWEVWVEPGLRKHLKEKP